MSNIVYKFNGSVGTGQLPDGTVFLFDVEKFDTIKDTKWYRNHKDENVKGVYLIDSNGNSLHSKLIVCPKGFEIDHINNNTLDNRLCNLRICTHQQNQCNQPLQRNNKSGVSGVSYYAPRKKYRARIKIGQHEIHLGYYVNMQQAIQARNVGVECMFGKYGQYNNVPPAPPWICDFVIKQCKRFADLSVCEAFFYANVKEPA